ncbi:MAG: molybdopterin molybdotransferase MoeA [Chloroflexi bacterium]|nr:molybdopterin molybdotransferase MoeA [Chloroflexota bacterium]
MTESAYAMITVGEALRIVLAQAQPLPPARVKLADALGLVLAEDALAQDPMPPFPSAGVDGFAIRVEDGRAPRAFQGEQMAGVVSGLRVAPGGAVRITTGAPVPPGADAIVMVEVAEEVNGQVILRHLPGAGDGIRPVGQDIRAGEVVLSRGTPLGAAEIGLLATIGKGEVLAHPRPRVAVFSTGDELVEVETALAPGKIRDSNRHALMAAVRASGAEPLSLGVARDNPADVEAKIDEALAAADAVISSGGVSMGKLDLVKPLLERRGTIHFGRVVMKPGKPVTFATIGGKPLFALPGFPVSSLVSFELFVRPALRRMAGHQQVTRPRIRVALAHDVQHDAARTEFQRAVAAYEDGQVVARTTGFQGSGRLLSLVGANVLLVLSAGRGDFAKGETVEALVVGEIY